MTESKFRTRNHQTRFESVEDFEMITHYCRRRFLAWLVLWLLLVQFFAWIAIPATIAGAQPPKFEDPIPSSPSTTIPEKISDAYWDSQFQRINKEVAAAKDSKVVFFGDSITKGWTLLDAAGKTVWQERFGKYNPINMGNSGDITPVMIYRIRHGNLDFATEQAPVVAVLLVGTNNYVVQQSDGGKVKWNLGIATPAGEVADGIRAVAQEFRNQLPKTRIILIGILPVKQSEKWAKCEKTNSILASYVYPRDEVVFLDLQDRFQDAEGQLKLGLFRDGTHLTTQGYEVLADALEPELTRLLELGPIK